MPNVFPMHSQPYLGTFLTDTRTQRLARRASELVDENVAPNEAVARLVGEFEAPAVNIGAQEHRPVEERARTYACDDAACARDGKYGSHAHTEILQRFVLHVQSGSEHLTVGVNGGPLIDPDFVSVRADSITMDAPDPKSRERTMDALRTQITRANAIVDEWNHNELPALATKAIEVARSDHDRRAAATAEAKSAGFKTVVQPPSTLPATPRGRRRETSPAADSSSDEHLQDGRSPEYVITNSPGASITNTVQEIENSPGASTSHKPHEPTAEPKWPLGRLAAWFDSAAKIAIAIVVIIGAIITVVSLLLAGPDGDSDGSSPNLRAPSSDARDEGEANHSEHRELVAWYSGMQGAARPTFNSFTAVPNTGDESEFLNGRVVGISENVWHPSVHANVGETVVVRVYIHNNADSSGNDSDLSGSSVALGTRLAAAIPLNSSTAHTLSATISASNATPREVSDTFEIITLDGAPIRLDYVEGSARLANAEFNSDTFTLPLSDDLFSENGTLIGYSALDGQFPGCFSYASVVTYELEVLAG